MSSVQTPLPKSSASKAAKKPRAKRVKKIKIKTEPVPVEIVTRLPNGLRAAWEVEYHNEDGQIRYHSLRDFVFDLQNRNVDVLKVEKMRAFLRRHSAKKSIARRTPVWLSTIKSIRRMCHAVPDYIAEDIEGDGANDGYGATWVDE